MRYLYILCLYCLPAILWSQCPDGDIVLSSQSEINAWGAAYPDCREVPGNLTIGKPYGATDITNLSPLGNVESIRGFLNISNNPLLPSLQGLDDLRLIRGYLTVFNNDSLTTLEGLSGLTSIDGFLWIIHNESLSRPDGLQNLRSINGSIEISHNPSLISLEGIENIDPESIAKSLSFLLTPVIDIKMITNGIPDLTLPANITAFLENNSPVNRFRRMLRKPYADRAEESAMLYQQIKDLPESPAANIVLDEISEVAQAAGNPMMVWESELLIAYYHLWHGPGSWTQRIARMKDLANRAGSEGIRHIQARALKFISFQYWDNIRDYEKTFKINHELLKVIEGMTPEEFPDMVECYNMMGMAHYRFRDYQTAIRFFRKGAELPKTRYNTTFVIHCNNNLGLSYQKLNIPDSSDYFFNRILRDTAHYAIEVWRGIAAGNLGYNFYLRKAYDETLPLLHQDISTAESLKYWGLAAGSLIPLADIQLIRGQLEKSWNTIRRARKYIQLSGEEDRYRLLYPVISKWHSAMGHQALASDYVDSTLQAIEQYNAKFDALKVVRAQQELNARELMLQEAERQRLVQQRNLIMVIILIVFVFGLIFLWFWNKNIQRKKLIRELAFKNTRKSLEHAQIRLGDLRQKIKENNQLINRLKQDASSNADPHVLQTLCEATILTKEDWVAFKNNFHEAYPGFLEIVRTRYTSLTPAEVRCLCLEKLQLTNEEMASMQGVSPKSINVTQYRIRKKLGLESQDDLEQLVGGIN